MIVPSGERACRLHMFQAHSAGRIPRAAMAIWSTTATSPAPPRNGWRAAIRSSHSSGPICRWRPRSISIRVRSNRSPGQKRLRGGQADILALACNGAVPSYHTLDHRPNSAAPPLAPNFSIASPTHRRTRVVVARSADHRYDEAVDAVNVRNLAALQSRHVILLGA